jgi:hypothetical protein
MARTTTPRIDLDAARAAAQARIVAIEKIAQTREAVLEAERADAAAYQEALRAGWSAQELKQFGVDEPVRRPPGRPRSARPQNGSRETSGLLGGHGGFASEQLRREAEASVALDRDQTHVVGEPVDTHGAPQDSPMEAAEHLRAAGHQVA